MSIPHSNGYFTKIADDTRQFFRSPGLVAVTTVAAVLIFLSRSNGQTAFFAPDETKAVCRFDD